MAHSNTLLAQILAVLPRHEFEALSRRHPAEVKPRNFTRWTHFVSMLTAQLAGLDSLRGIVDYFSIHSKQLYHPGIRTFSRSTLSRANTQESTALLFQSVFYKLLSRCRELAPGRNKCKFKGVGKVYLLDSTLIRLSLSLFPCASYRTGKGAAKAHIGIDSDGYIPTFVEFTEGSRNDVKWAGKQQFPKYSCMVFDRGYIDYKWFKRLTGDGVYFVTRLKKNSKFKIIKKRSGRKVENILEDAYIKFNGVDTIFRYIHFIDPNSENDDDKEYEFLTNAHHISADTVAGLYKERWQVELFFKWIKQHLKVKSFVGASMNAVRIQLWTALCVYLLVAFLQFRSRLGLSFWAILRKLRFILFERRELSDLFILPEPKIPRKIKCLSKG